MATLSVSLLISTAVGLGAPEFQRLPNGLRLAVIEDHSLPLVSVQVWYRVGSAVDDPQHPGLCHIARTVLENRHDAALRLRAAGVRTDAGTLRDACFFHSVLPPQLLTWVLGIEAERMQPAATTAEELRLAVAAAARSSGSRTAGQPPTVERQLLAALFPDHPYMHPPELVAESWRDAHPAEVDEFLRRRFTPANATLLIVGDIQTSTALELARQHFDSLPRSEAERPPDVRRPGSETIRLSPVAAEVAGLDMAWLAPSATAADSLAVSVLMQRLCNPADGPLYRRLSELGCLAPRWRHERWRSAGLVSLHIDWVCEEPPADGPTPQRVENIVREELRRAVEAVPTEIELGRARSLAARDLHRLRAAFGDRALSLGWQEHVAGDILRADFDIPYVERLTVGQLQRAAAELLETRTVILPRVVATDSTAAASAPSPALPAPLPGAPPQQLDTAAALDLLATAVRNAPESRSPRAPGYSTRVEISPQVAVTVWRLPGLEWATVRTALRTPRPHRYLPAVLLAVGSTKRSVAEYREYLSFRGLDMFPVGDLSLPGLSSTGRAALAPQMIELQADLVRSPDARPATLQKALDALNHAIFRRAMQPWEELEDEYYLPPGLIGWSETGRVMPQIVEQLEAILGCLEVIEGVDLFVAGDVEVDAVVTAARTAWEGWRPAAPSSRPIEGRPQSPETSSGGERATGLPASTQPAVTPQATQPATVRAVSVWATVEDEPVSVHIADELSPMNLPPALRVLAEQTTVWLLGVPWHVPPTLDAGRAWLWTCGWVEPAWLDAAMQPATDLLAPHVETFLRQAEQVARGTVSAARLETAARLARADRLMMLDSTAAIVELLSRGVSNPWDVLDGCTTEELRAAVGQLYRVRERSIVGSGPGNRSAELERFGNWPPTTLPSRSP